MPLPELILAGGHKCGTTSLFRLLGSHPLLMPSAVKEPHFLIHEKLIGRIPNIVGSIDQYRKLWPVGAERCMEASVLYLPYAVDFAHAIHSYFEDPPHVLVIVRDPVARSVSSYYDIRLKGPVETAPTLEAALEREWRLSPIEVDPMRVPTIQHLALSHYADNIKFLQESLGPNNVTVALFDDLVGDAQTLVQRVLRNAFGTELPSWAAELTKENPGGMQWRSRAVQSVARSRLAVRARRRLRRVAPEMHRRLGARVLESWTVRSPQLASGLRRQLEEFFSDEVGSLETLLGRSLDAWRSPK